jgi:hypothetical protein
LITLFLTEAIVVEYFWWWYQTTYTIQWPEK